MKRYLTGDGIISVMIGLLVGFLIGYAVKGTETEIVEVPVEVEVEKPVTLVIEKEIEVEVPAKEPEPKYANWEYELMARVLTAEADGEPLIGKIAVIVTILNRMDCRNMLIYDVIFEDDQYAIADNYTDENLEIAKKAEKYRDLFPHNMVYFRNEHYHEFGKRYTIIGHHYFSIEPKYAKEESNE